MRVDGATDDEDSDGSVLTTMQTATSPIYHHHIITSSRQLDSIYDSGKVICLIHRIRLTETKKNSQKKIKTIQWIHKLHTRDTVQFNNYLTQLQLANLSMRQYQPG